MFKKYYKKFSLILLLIYISLIFTGCWDYMDLEDRSLVVSFGLDSPAPDRVRFDAEIAEFITSSPQQASYNLSHFFGEGSNFDKARVDLQVQVRGPLSNGAATTVILSERFAMSDLLEPYLNRANRQFDLRKTITLIISRKTPEELFNLSDSTKSSIGFFIENNVNTLFERSHIDVSIGDAASASRIKGLGLVIPCIDIVDGKVQYIGLGVIKDFKLVDIIDLWDSPGVLFIMSPKTPLVLTMDDPKFPNNILTFTTLAKNPKIKTRYENGKVFINVSLSVNASLQFQYYLEGKTEDDIKDLEEALSKHIKKIITEQVQKSQHDYKVDIFQFVKYFRAQNPIVYRKVDWEKVYPEAEVNINVKSNITDKNAMDYENKKELNKR